MSSAKILLDGVEVTIENLNNYDRLLGQVKGCPSIQRALIGIQLITKYVCVGKVLGINFDVFNPLFDVVLALEKRLTVTLPR